MRANRHPSRSAFRFFARRICTLSSSKISAGRRVRMLSSATCCSPSHVCYRTCLAADPMDDLLKFATDNYGIIAIYLAGLLIIVQMNRSYRQRTKHWTAEQKQAEREDPDNW